MAVTTTILAYFADLLPQTIDNNMALIDSSNNAFISRSDSVQDN